MSGPIFDPPRFKASGDTVLLVELGDAIDLAVNEAVRALTERLRRDPPAGLKEVLPAYRSLAVMYDPLAIAPQVLEAHIGDMARHLDTADIPPPRTVEIPVCYGGEFGPDIGFVAAHNGIDEDQVIALHSAHPYHIYTIGFAPGFCYLGGLDPRLHTPRLETPRTKVPAGAVGIAESQTGIYPLPSPGGWRLIGRTPLKLFDARRRDPFLYQAGDSLQFVAISPEQYHALQAEEEA